MNLKSLISKREEIINAIKESNFFVNKCLISFMEKSFSEIELMIEEFFRFDLKVIKSAKLVINEAKVDLNDLKNARIFYEKKTTNKEIFERNSKLENGKFVYFKS
ncbi:MAG TPA: hypothetical protein VN854_01040 [Mycoplasmatales bacterium]|nr:hypothetical protein [Mycoplasmatales bacterium]